MICLKKIKDEKNEIDMIKAIEIIQVLLSFLDDGVNVLVPFQITRDIEA